jgi:heat-inducible transcriptional repressor
MRMNDGQKILTELNDRSREVFRRVVEGYLDSAVTRSARAR